MDKMADVPIRYAYHVTNVPETEPQPDWAELWAKRHFSALYDGMLTNLQEPCVKFSTTLYQGESPTISPFPLTGQTGIRYWRVKIPIEHFVRYTKFWMSTGDNGRQHRLVLTKDEDEERKIAALEGVEKIPVDTNPYLRRTPDGRWYSNDYDNEDTHYFTGFSVFGNFPLSGEGINAKWDLVPWREPDEEH